jgi:cardiolipin synthase
MLVARHAGRGNYRDLLASGMRIFEYPSAILYARTLVVDDYVSVVGSSNLGFRYCYFNAEFNVFIFDDLSRQTMAQVFEEDPDHSWEIQLEA